jgi:hypothetical protein
MKKQILLLLMAACMSLTAMAQIEWLAKEYDFGSFKEAAGSVTGSVGFINRGSKATYIKTVRPSCGCTGAKFTTDMIEPGDTAVVSFTYNPAGRPGKFDKTVKVFIGDDAEMTVIRIKGTVIGSPETLESRYPHKVGALRLDSDTLLTGEIKRGNARHLFMNVYNESPDTIVPGWKSDDKALTVDLIPKEIAPGDIGTFSFYVRSSDEKRDGVIDYPVTIISDTRAPSPEEKTIHVKATIK